VSVVVDASALVAALADGGTDGAWATEALEGATLAAPHLMPIEAANIMRRAAVAGAISTTTAALAPRDLLDLRVQLWPYSSLAERCWELRGNLTTYDATYVALAELLEMPLVTLDRRLAAAPGPRCRFVAPA
jgi:predicted nucleic acid-binding protein